MCSIMDNIISKIQLAFGTDFVVVGSYAMYLQGIKDTFSGKDVDIAIDVNNDKYDNISGYNKNTSNKFGYGVWTKKVEDLWVEAFNRPLPDFDLLNIDNILVKVESIQSMKDFYNSLDIDNIQGHDNFKNRLRSNKELVNAQ